MMSLYFDCIENYLVSQYKGSYLIKQMQNYKWAFKKTIWRNAFETFFRKNSHNAIEHSFCRYNILIAKMKLQKKMVVKYANQICHLFMLRRFIVHNASEIGHHEIKSNRNEYQRTYHPFGTNIELGAKLQMIFGMVSLRSQDQFCRLHEVRISVKY